MNDCYILLIGKMRFIYYELKYIKKPHVLVLPDMWLFYYKYITKLSNIAINLALTLEYLLTVPFVIFNSLAISICFNPFNFNSLTFFNRA